MKPEATERTARMALSCVVEGGDLKVADALSNTDASTVWTAARDGALGEGARLRATRLELDEVIRRAAGCGARFVIPADKEWPDGLNDLSYAESVQDLGGVPPGLWLRGPGRLDDLMSASVAIVGSRASSSYGEGVAGDLAADLAEQGIAIASGGAFGIDAAAHRGALAVRGQTVAVLACGVDVPYPRGNAALFDWLAKDHLLVSELPPGATPSRVRFLSRNRLIAALAQGTVVVEAAVRSGARNTANWAQQCHRPLMAVPGPVHSTLSAGPHLMIREQQAILVTKASDVLEVISAAGDNLIGRVDGGQRPLDLLSQTRLAVYEALPSRGASSVDEVALKAGVSITTCLVELSELESGGLAVATESGWRIRSGPPGVQIGAEQSGTGR